MLVYHPAFDLYSCVFRIFQLLTFLKQKELEVDRLRILDFYLAFPSEISKIKFPQDLLALKTLFKKRSPNVYEELIDEKRIFDRMKAYQLSALKCIASYGFIDNDSLNKGIVRKTDKVIPEEILTKVNELSVEKENTIKFIVGFQDLPLYGSFGVKYRTGLLDFKYDRI